MRRQNKDAEAKHAPGFNFFVAFYLACEPCLLLLKLCVLSTQFILKPLLFSMELRFLFLKLL